MMSNEPQLDGSALHVLSNAASTPLHLSIKYFADEEMVSKGNLSKIMSRMVSKLSLQTLYLPWLFQLHSETTACSYEEYIQL